MTNKALGNAFERKLCATLYSKGFWVHNLQQNAAGQPADIIAVRDGKAFLVDCKWCSDDYFHLSRIEENQHLAMSLWEKRGNGPAWFAISIRGEVWMVRHSDLMNKRIFSSRVTYDDIKRAGIDIEGWCQ